MREIQTGNSVRCQVMMWRKIKPVGVGGSRCPTILAEAPARGVSLKDMGAGEILFLAEGTASAKA